jgi:hypothetical protein
LQENDYTEVTSQEDCGAGTDGAVISFYMRLMQLELNDNSIGLENVQTETSLTDNVETKRLLENVLREMFAMTMMKNFNHKKCYSCIREKLVIFLFQSVSIVE